MPNMLRADREGRVMTIRVENPPHNFMNREMVAELDELTQSLDADRSIRSVVITGGLDGRFVTHYDVAEIVEGAEGVGIEVNAATAGASLGVIGGLKRVGATRAALLRTPAAGMVELHAIHDLLTRLGRLDKVVIAAINGPAVGGGCELALACDLRYMAADAVHIGLPEITLGIHPGAGGTQRLSRLVGPGRALEMILEGEALPPQAALDAGLVHRVTTPADLLSEATETAQRLARRSSESVAGTKRAIREGSSMPLSGGLALERRWFLAVASTPVSHRGMRAYVDEVESSEEPPWATEAGLLRWRGGEVVDLGDG